MAVQKCTWVRLFNNNEKNSLEEGFFNIGILCLVLGVWLNLSLLISNLRQDRSYRNLANFTMVACIRKALAMLPYANKIGRSSEYQQYSNIFAFLETFLAVFEVEWLTHVCIERYVLAKYATKGWRINKSHYTLFKSLCIFFAALYSFLPLFGIGKYGFDFSCTFWTFDMVLPDSWQKFVIVTIYFFRSIKPSAVIMMTLLWACVLEENLKVSDERRRVEGKKRRIFTRNMIIIALVNLLCWTPIALVRGGVLVSQLIYSHLPILTSVIYIKWALWIHWIAPAMTAAILFLVDEDIRNKMLFNFNDTNNDELSTEESKEQKEK